MKIKFCLPLIAFLLQSFICVASPTINISYPIQYDEDETTNIILYECRRTRNGGGWGYKNKTTGEILIECQYRWADNFHQGIARVCSGSVES